MEVILLRSELFENMLAIIYNIRYDGRNISVYLGI